jgi:drug/metabolite transporter (DMT)-like permease
MLYVFLSICCSIVVSILLKLAKRYQVDIFQAITWNYSMAIILAWLFLKPQLQNLQTAPFYIYGLLGLLLPGLFVVIAISVRLSGIVRTEIAQRLSLFIPILAAFLWFDEKITPLKIVGILIGFVAITCSFPLQKTATGGRKIAPNSLIYLIVVFVGMGIIDVLFKQMALAKGVGYTASLFMVYVIAFVMAFIGLLYRFVTKQSKFSWPHILFGWILGVANFGNILFYLKAHRALATSPSTVFSAMNIGVIVLGAFVGLLVFKEKLSTLNKAGIVLALVAIVVITYANR